MKSFAKRAVAILVVSTLAACGGGGGGGGSTSVPITTGVSNPVVTPVAPVNAGIFIQPASPTKVTASATATAMPTKFAAAIKVNPNKTIPVFNGTTATLTLPNVKLGSSTFGEVQLRHEGSGIFSLLNSPTVDASSPTSASSYSTDTGVLTLKSVMVDDHRFTNVALHLEVDGKFKLTEVNDPILVQKTSYLNTKNLNIPSQDLPMLFVGKTYFSTNAYALGDFFQDGTLSLVTSTIEYDPTKPISEMKPGHIQFWKKDSIGKWVDYTSKIMTDNSGCYHPRRAIVADFNNDGIPDVFFACHGYDGPIADSDKALIGEEQRILLSQPDGTYKNTIVPIRGFIHSASAADINNDGLVDILVTDPGKQQKPFFLMNTGNGQFKPDYTKFNSTISSGACTFLTNYTCSWPIYTVELIDYNNDGKIDVFLAGSSGESDVRINFKPTLIAGDGSGNFNTSKSLELPLEGNKFNLTLDIAIIGNSVYLLNVPGEHGDGYYFGHSIQKIDLTTLTSTILFENTGRVNNQPNAPVWCDWIAPYENTIISVASQYQITVSK